MNEPGIVGGNCFRHFYVWSTYLHLDTETGGGTQPVEGCGGGEQSQGLLKVHPSIFCHLFRSGLGDSRFIEVTLNQHLNLGYPEASPDKKPNLLSMSQLDMPRRLSLEDA